jgi:hypothetical protein
MDLNQLYFEHQSRKMKATASTSQEIRDAHEKVASLIAGKIGQMQHAMGAAAAASWTAHASRNAFNDEPARPTLLPVQPRLQDEVSPDLVSS